jgi:UDP-glucose 4-epimerase
VGVTATGENYLTYLVTGGTGFIGSNIIKLLLGEESEVVTYDTVVDRNSIQNLLNKEELERVTFVRGDVTDLARLINTVRKYKVDRIVHLAYILTGGGEENPTEVLNIGIQGIINVLETANILGIKKVVWASSDAVFGEASKYPEVVPNDAPHYPTNMYALGKSVSEFLATHYFKKMNVDSIGLRPTMVYGPARLRGAGLFTVELINKPALGLPGKVAYSNSPPQDFIHVEDVARAFIMASKVPTTKTRNSTLGVGWTNTIPEIADIVRKYIPGADITYVEPKDFYYDLPGKFDVTCLHSEIGFSPKYSMEEGIRRTIEVVREMHSRSAA